jgi:hypothetical protein
MRRSFNFIGVLLLCLCCFYHRAAAQSLAEAKVDSSHIRIGEQTKFRILVHQPVKERINFPQLKDSLTGKVQIVSVGKRDTVMDQNDKNRLLVTQSYTVTSFDEGTYTIPAFPLGSSEGTLKTNEVILQVQTVKVDTTKGIYDIKQPLAVSYTWLDWLRDHWIWVVIPLVVILAIIGLIIYLKKRPKKAITAPVVKTYLPPHTIALNKLQELRAKKLWQQGEFKVYYSDLSDILRDYLEVRYVIKTQEKTTDEILDGIRHLDITDQNKNLLRQILKLADLVKFAKEKPVPAENELSIDNAISFITNTQQVFTPQPTTEGGSANASV